MSSGRSMPMSTTISILNISRLKMILKSKKLLRKQLLMLKMQRLPKVKKTWMNKRKSKSQRKPNLIRLRRVSMLQKKLLSTRQKRSNLCCLVWLQLVKHLVEHRVPLVALIKVAKMVTINRKLIQDHPTHLSFQNNGKSKSVPCNIFMSLSSVASSNLSSTF